MEKGGAWGPIYPFHECNYTFWQKKDASREAPPLCPVFLIVYMKTAAPKNFGRFENRCCDLATGIWFEGFSL
jgi:hypothetical protein